jgi:SAM-dependent methyltransferase
MRAFKVAQPHLFFLLNILKKPPGKKLVYQLPHINISEIAVKFQPPFLEAVKIMEKLPCKSTAIIETVRGNKILNLDVPFVPTPLEIVNEMLEMTHIRPGDRLYDLGCGDGRIVITAAKKYNIDCIGVDLDPRRIQECRINTLKASVSDKVTFLQSDLFDVDLREASIVSIYLLSNINLKLRSKLFNELRPGSRVISHDFNMDRWLADKSVSRGNHSLFLWTIPANMSGNWRWTLPFFSENLKFNIEIKQHFQKAHASIITPENALVKALSICGDLIRLKLQIISNRHRVPVHLSGNITGDKIKGRFRISGMNYENWYASREKNSKTNII